MNKQQLTRKMAKMGMAWAVSDSKCIDTNDRYGAKPAYHIHPDSSYPHQDSIKRFGSLKEIEGYIKACEAAEAASSDTEAFAIMQKWQEEYYSG